MGQTKQIGRINELFFYKMYGRFAVCGQKSGSNNEVTVLPRWPQGGVSLYYRLIHGMFPTWRSKRGPIPGGTASFSFSLPFFSFRFSVFLVIVVLFCFFI